MMQPMSKEFNEWVEVLYEVAGPEYNCRPEWNDGDVRWVDWKMSDTLVLLIASVLSLIALVSIIGG